MKVGFGRFKDRHLEEIPAVWLRFLKKTLWRKPQHEKLYAAIVKELKERENTGSSF